MKTGRISLVGLSFALFAAACSSGQSDGDPGTGGSTGAAGNPGGAGSPGAAGSTGAAGNPGGAGSPGAGGSTGVAGGTGVAGSPGPGAAGSPGAGGSTGVAGSPAGAAGKGGSTGVAGGAAGAGVAGSGAGGSGPGGSGSTPANVLVTSASGNYWKTGTYTESTGSATVTVNDTSTQQKWEGFGGAFNELGWKVLTSASTQTQAVNLLFSATDGAHFAWGRIPIGASDYAESRYTLVDTAGADPAPNSGETNRPTGDLTTFSLSRDMQKLIPYIKAAQAVNPALKFWASPWTPPVWMKTGFKKNSGADMNASAKKPSYYDGGNMKSDAAILTAYADYYKKFVQGYKDMGINIDIVSPQNEPGYDQNYPSCLWDATTYKTFIGKYLGPAMQPLNVKIMLGSLSNDATDFSIAQSAASDPTAKPFLAVIGAQWNTLDKAKLDGLNSGLPVWASEHKCGNYPWNPSTGCGDASDSCPAYNSSKAPNDQAYGVESWKYIRNAIKTVKVTSYNAWNMVLDASGLGIDTTRDWKQDALLVASGSSVTPTPAYYVFRHLSQYVVPGANVVGTTGGDAVAFKNPDGSIVAVVYNSGAANSSFVVAIGSKKYQFSMPSNGWATLKITP
jgi:glucosylceramidase